MNNRFRERRRPIGRKTGAAVSSVPGKEDRMYDDEDHNFLQETKGEIEGSGHTTDDIEFIGNRNRTISLGGWEGFAKVIDRTYNDGYGGNEVVDDLAIFFRDHSVIFRREYDGAEWWDYIPSSESHREPPVAVLDPNKAWVHPSDGGVRDYEYSLESWYRNTLKEESEKSIEEKMSRI